MIPVFCITTTNRADLFAEMIKTIDYPIKRMSVLVNNYSVEYLLEIRSLCQSEYVEEFMVSHCPYNMGFGGSCNYHFKMNCDAPYWIVSADDMLFAPGDLEMANSALQEYDFLGNTTCTCLGIIFGMTRKCIDLVGFFDENIHPVNFEDNDFWARVQHHNVKHTRVPFKSHHIGSQTFVGYEEDVKNFVRWDMNGPYELNRIYYENKILNRGDFTEGKFNFEERSKKLVLIKNWVPVVGK